MKGQNRKVIFVVSEDWYFLSHRLDLAQYFRESGWEVLVATQVHPGLSAERISGAGLRLIPLPLERGRLLSFGDFLYWWRLVRLYRNEYPDVVHHVAMKPVLYGSIAALCIPRTGVINALAGLGYLFTKANISARLVRRVVLACFRRLFVRPNTRVILQNSDDMALFRDRLGVPASNLRLIRGAGVDVNGFHPVLHGPREAPVVVMVARMLRDKGVLDLVGAARLLARRGVAATIQLVGGVDDGNPNSHTRMELERLEAEGVIRWLGHQTDIPGIYGRADIAVLPTVYPEGLPKSLLEAAASGLPIVTNDIPGCREVVADGVNGYLVPPHDVEALAAALRRLILDPDLRAHMGAAGRQRVASEFRQELILQQTAAVYEEVAHA